MRTTVNLNDEVRETCRDLAEQPGVSLGDAMGSLIRRGLAYRTPVHERNGFAVFDSISDQPEFGLDEVNRALADEDAGYAAFFVKPKA